MMIEALVNLFLSDNEADSEKLSFMMYFKKGFPKFKLLPPVG